MSGRAQQPVSKSASLLRVALTYGVAAAVAVAVGVALRGAHPISVVAAADVAATSVVFAASVWANNTSLYDPYWSVAPPAIVAYWVLTAEGDPNSARQLIIVALVALWATRLTANWVRRWRGLDDEDWRYADMRPKAGRAYWLVSLFAFQLMPTAIVLLGCLPLYYALSSPRPLGWFDAVAALLTAGAIVIETVADEQLRRFVRSPDASGRTLASGLWAWCRHPNYLGEILFWWGLYGFALATAPASYWTGVGGIAMTLLFVFISVPLIDRRMLARRPGYGERMKRVPALLPWPGERRR